MLDSDFVALYDGKLKAPQALLFGKVKIKVNKKAALSFKPEVIMEEIGEDIWEAMEEKTEETIKKTTRS